jgi:pimeloyl-ACP methyl ester carboxylesterase
VFTESAKAKIAYDIVGEPGAGHDVVLIHAGVTDRRSWADLIARLAPRHRCMAYDQRGYGETTYDREDGWSPIEDALTVMDVVGLTCPVLVGCSMGGGYAIDFTLAHPERVAGLVLIAAAVRGAPDVELEPNGPTATIDAALTAADELGDVEEVVRLDAHLWLDGPAAPEGRVGGEARSLFLDMDRRAELAPSPGDPAEIPSAWPRLHEIKVPTLVLTGRLDAEPLLVRGPQLAELIPQAQFKWLEGVAHLPHMERDAATLSAISEFVDSLPASN